VSESSLHCCVLRSVLESSLYCCVLRSVSESSLYCCVLRSVSESSLYCCVLRSVLESSLHCCVLRSVSESSLYCCVLRSVLESSLYCCVLCSVSESSLYCCVHVHWYLSYKLNDVTKDALQVETCCSAMKCVCQSELSAHFVPPVAIHFRFCTVITWRPGPVTVSLVVYCADLVNPNMWIAMRINQTSAY